MTRTTFSIVVDFFALMAVSGTTIALIITTFTIYLNQFIQSIGISPT